ncbi:TonB-dependent siderophore receptor [Sphingomonas sp. SUN039]|uniref:TonB-dependent receptor plug domain-containing protein n=1 Tax=Sphingomonas sp. SUN039 TaxID=2937787 RepID=UPI002164AC0B|nr:TonB-dependent receptor [Sphingomonas sp. SUN039]UVO54404.1 TonB-dependent receptor [Sphingomonas sp. SUN039]
MISYRALMLASLSAAAMVSAPAFAQTPQATPQAAEEAPAGQDIIVIGTRRTDRSVTDSASPIDVIGATDLAASPQVNMLDTIKNLVPSFFVPQNTISDASTFVRAPSLRGLGADQILVMINGKRYNRSALVNVYTGADTALSFGSQGSDIGNIPTIAIKNLQVLRDGATAQYGADALAGVLNYAIRNDEGFEAQGLYGKTYRGDGVSKILSGYGGLKIGDRGFISLAGEWYDQGQTSRGVTRASAITIQANLPNVAVPNPAQIWGTSPGTGYKLFLNAAVDVGAQSQIYFTGNLAHSDTNQSFNYRPSQTNGGFVRFDGTSNSTVTLNRNGSFNPIFLTACPAASVATCPTGGFVNDANTFSFATVYPGGFTPRFIGVVDQAYGTLGFKGKSDSGFTYDISASLSRNSLDLSMTNSLSASFGPQSQTSFKFGKLIQGETVLNADFTYPLEVGFDSPITLSAGAEYRRERYEKTVGDVQSYAAGPYASQTLYNLVTPAVGATPAVYTAAGITATQSPAASGYGGVSPNFAGAATQSNWGIYVGAEADVTKALTIGLAGRYENYNTFGGVVVGKANALWRVSDAVSLRATVGTGFHAPSPGQNNTQVVTTNFLGGNQVQTGTYPTTSAIAQFYGAGSLAPERSTNFGAGIVLKPTSRLSLTVDGYIIEIKNRIGISQNYTVTAANITALPALATVGLGGVVNYFTNGFDVSSKGIEAVANYRTELMGGPLNFTLAYSYNNLKSKNIKLTTTGTQLVSLQQQYNIANLAPQHRITASAGWQVGGFSVNARANYYGSWSNALEYNLVAPVAGATTAPPSQIFGAKTLFDLDASYTFADHFTLTVGANNLFNVYPDKIAASPVNPIYALSGGLNDGQVYPRSGGPFGINGGFYYVRLRVKY